MDLLKNKISNASSEVNLNSNASSEVNLISTTLSEVYLNSKHSKDKIINFLLDNRDVGQIIIDYFRNVGIYNLIVSYTGTWCVNDRNFFTTPRTH